MRDKDTKLIWENFNEGRRPGEEEIPGHDDDDPIYGEIRDDKHNPPDNPGPNSGDVYAAMDKQSSFDHIASQYRDLEEDELESRLATLKSHVDVLEDLLEMDDAQRRAAQGQGY